MNKIITIFNDIAELEDGWMDGQGLAYNREHLNWLLHTFINVYSDDLPLPNIYPTIDNHISMEWTINNWESSLDIDLKTHEGYWTTFNMINDNMSQYNDADDTNDNSEKTCNLNNDNEWLWIKMNIAKQMGQ